MARLRTAAAALIVLIARPASAGNLERWEPYVAEASARFGVPSEWIRRVIEAESNGLTSFNGIPITSRAGAIGLMQLMPATWGDMRRAYGLGFDPYAPRDNILAGTAYLRLMYDRFGYPGMFAAYNAGPKRYSRILAGGRLPAETANYLVKVAASPRPAFARPLPDRAQTMVPALLVRRKSDSRPVSSNPSRGPLFAIQIAAEPAKTLGSPDSAK